MFDVRRTVSAGFACFALLVAAGPLVISPALGFENPPPIHFPQELSQSDRDALADLDRLSRAYTLIAQAVKPSVVSIKSSAVNGAVNDELKRLFGENSFQPIPTTGTGSGLIIDEVGHIVTNNHVIADADVVRVTLADGREFRAKIVASDPNTDIAVIKIDADRLRPGRFGDSDAAEVGNIVLAIGSPFKFGHSVSHGIISAVGRSEVDVDIEYKNWIQTDAPINPGNSGGPLINTHGEVIGISVAIATDSGGHQGVGFAIPSNTVVRIADQLKLGKKVVRGLLGVAIQPVDTKTASAYGLSEALGALISTVEPKSPAELGGLHAEDIVLSYNGKKIANHDILKDSIAATLPGTEVTLSVWRHGVASDMKVTIGEKTTKSSADPSFHESRHHREQTTSDDGRERAEPNDKNDNSLSLGELGLEVSNLTPRLAKRYHLDRDELNGVLVTGVDPTGEAFAANLTAGHVIVRANDKDLRNIGDFREILTPKALAKGVRIKVAAGSKEFFAVLRVR
jgi:serine protease Do